MENSSLYSEFTNYMINSGQLEETKTLSTVIEDSLTESRNFIQTLKKTSSSLNSCVSMDDGMKREELTETSLALNYCVSMDDGMMREELTETSLALNYCVSMDDGMKREELTETSLALEEPLPKLLLEDMEDLYEIDLNLEETKSKLEQFLSIIRKETPALSKIIRINPDLREMEKEFRCNMDKLAASIQLFEKRLVFIKTMPKVASERNPVMKEKLMKLCDETELFYTMLETKCRAIEDDKSTIITNTELPFHDVLKTILVSMNEVLYLMDYKES